MFIVIVGGFIVVNNTIKKYFRYFDILHKKNIFLALIFGPLLVLAGILVFQKSPAFINDPNFYNTTIRSGLEFLVGLFLYKAFLGKYLNPSKYQKYLINFLGVVGVGIWFCPIPLYIIVAYWLILIPFIVVISLEKESIFYRFLTHPFLLHLGNISYSLYLIHGPIERIIAALYPKLDPSMFNIISMYLVFIISILVFASIAHKYIEKPVIKYFKKDNTKVFVT